MIVGDGDQHDKEHQQDQRKDQIRDHAQLMIRQRADNGDSGHGQGQDQEDQQHDPGQAQLGGGLLEGGAHIAALLLHDPHQLRRQAPHVPQELAQGEGRPGEAHNQHHGVNQLLRVQLDAVVPLRVLGEFISLLPDLHPERVHALAGHLNDLAAGQGHAVHGDRHLHPGQKQHGGAGQDQHHGDDLHHQGSLGFRRHSITLFPS